MNVFIATYNTYFKKGLATYIEEAKRTKKMEDRNIDFHFFDGDVNGTFFINTMIYESAGKKNVIISDVNLISFNCFSFSKNNSIIISIDDCGLNFIEGLFYNNFDKIRFKGLNAINFSNLSAKEKKVCYYIACGYQSRIIGVLLNIHEKSVSSHRVSIMRKLGCLNRIELYKMINKIYNNCLLNYV